MDPVTLVQLGDARLITDKVTGLSIGTVRSFKFEGWPEAALYDLATHSVKVTETSSASVLRHWARDLESARSSIFKRGGETGLYLSVVLKPLVPPDLEAPLDGQPLVPGVGPQIPATVMALAYGTKVLIYKITEAVDGVPDLMVQAMRNIGVIKIAPFIQHTVSSLTHQGILPLVTPLIDLISEQWARQGLTGEAAVDATAVIRSALGIDVVLDWHGNWGLNRVLSNRAVRTLALEAVLLSKAARVIRRPG